MGTVTAPLTSSMQVVTGADGLYLFENLDPGDYCVQFDITALPDDFCDTDGFALGAPQFTALNVGGDPAVDSDADPRDRRRPTPSPWEPVRPTVRWTRVSSARRRSVIVSGKTRTMTVSRRTVSLACRESPSDSLTADPMVSPVRTTTSIRARSRVTDVIDGLYMFGAEPGSSISNRVITSCSSTKRPSRRFDSRYRKSTVDDASTAIACHLTGLPRARRWARGASTWIGTAASYRRRHRSAISSSTRSAVSRRRRYPVIWSAKRRLQRQCWNILVPAVQARSRSRVKTTKRRWQRALTRPPGS